MPPWSRNALFSASGDAVFDGEDPDIHLPLVDARWALDGCHVPAQDSDP